MPRKTTAPLQIGDRVIERDRVGDHVATAQSPNYDTVCRIMGHRRYGLVTDVITKANRRGSRITYAQVVWDGLNSPSLHAQSRLQRVSSSVQEEPIHSA